MLVGYLTESQISKTEKPIHSIYWKNIRRVKGIYTMATSKRKSKHTNEPNDSSERPKREKHKSLSRDQNQMFFFLPKNPDPYFLALFGVFILRAGLGGDVYKGGRDHETHNQRKEWVSTP
jgi:hypothetical protein